ncbi:magnesium and cobalt transport protein CorA [Thalassoporum mexicanum PCC 7367]|uniref:magnesium/cobalt transporter CorA n=1 Tax=Thalassoporum mexicanum TaxID=3457544 RepID=UPI00029FEFFB|nr:magnesium/cobalt transporter CorA [Pseudanabaena sp. PCC 7367]AFY70455.1 magnesium and cobalt transport protein CorA [Pseudanabaena sp. PCC 7367]
MLQESYPKSAKPIDPIQDDEEEEYDEFDYAYNEPGSLPGTLIIDEDATVPNIFLIDYHADNVTGMQLLHPEDCTPYLESESVSWVDVQGLGSEDVLQRIGQVFKIHPLILEDVVNIPQRPKVEEYDDRLLIITHMVTPKNDGIGFISEQVSFVLGKNYLLTVQEEPEHDTFEVVRERIHRNKGSIRNQRADYLSYCLIDTIIDGFFPVLEDYGERLEDLQDAVLANPSSQSIDAILRIRRELLLLRRAIWPQREAIKLLIRDDSTLLSDSVRVYFSDCYDHVVQVIDMLETYRELASSLMDVYLSSISMRTNEVMQVLTVISVIFMPLTFIAGVYGMNFNPQVSPWNMPELEWSYGYVTCWALMIVTAGTMIIYFWRKGWLGKTRIAKTGRS